MKFKSAFNNTSKLTFLGIFLILIIPLIFIIQSRDFTTSILISVVNIAVLLLLIWILLKTEYEITDEKLKCQSGPFKKSISIQEINAIESHKGILVPSLCKLSLSHEGFVIRYKKFDTIYISPSNSQQFLNELTTLNPNIQII